MTGRKNFLFNMTETFVLCCGVCLEETDSRKLHVKHRMRRAKRC